MQTIDLEGHTGTLRVSPAGTAERVSHATGVTHHMPLNIHLGGDVVECRFYKNYKPNYRNALALLRGAPLLRLLRMPDKYVCFYNEFTRYNPVVEVRNIVLVNTESSTHTVLDLLPYFTKNNVNKLLDALFWC